MLLEKNINKILYYIIFLFPLILITGPLFINISTFIFSIFFFKNLNNFKNTYYFKSYFYLFIIFYIYLNFNSLIADNNFLSFNRSFFYIRFFLFFFLVIFFLESTALEFKNKMSIIWAIIILFISADVIFQSFFGFNIVGYKTPNITRNSSFFFDELIAGSFILGIGYLSASLFYYFSKNKFYFIIFLIFITVACLLTGERSNFIKSFIILLSILIYIFPKKQIKNFLGVLFLVISISLTVLFNSNVLERYSSSISWSEKNNQNLPEQYLFSHYGAHALTSIYIFKDNIFFGVGNKNFRVKCHDYQDILKEKYKIRAPGCSTHPHQIYYELLSEHGLLGTLFVMWFFFLIVKRRLKRKINIINFASLAYILTCFIPILPSGSFFTTHLSIIFWLNLSFFVTKFNKN